MPGTGRGLCLCLCVLSGLPAAGKSRLAQTLLARLERTLGDCILVPYDEIIPEEAFQGGGTETLSDWKSYRHQLLVYIEQFLLSVTSSSHLPAPESGTSILWEQFVYCLQRQGVISTEVQNSKIYPFLRNKATSRPLFIILDDNFYYQSMRYEVYQLARRNSLGFCQLFLDCPLKCCLQRNHQRNCQVTDDTIVLMAEKIEAPNPAKYSWEQQSLILSSIDCILEDVVEKVIALLTTALENPLKPVENGDQKEIDRAICAASILHQADQDFRRLVSQAMKSAKDNKMSVTNMKLLVKELNELKAHTLEDLRHKAIQEDSMSRVVEELVAQFVQKKDNLVQKFIQMGTISVG
ncbi:L-seryl-tRNA(Sec) kinase [Latimeria chalumnae]|uniref:Phosphoseryl-tRNA kinase n=1 Tax=Latimeria chalumnae TaxID=7897 RepID=M3XH21_LATCH|nr:PREDICTED: L-seryl-tRNA(Sec) kinase [Latimeria chalumnae]|eukprot:XP_006001800.1 PREDICTED: L-seryl-tRNA(Sec) kinase [Latimeria chalumnae]